MTDIIRRRRQIETEGRVGDARVDAILIAQRPIDPAIKCFGEGGFGRRHKRRSRYIRRVGESRPSVSTRDDDGVRLLVELARGLGTVDRNRYGLSRR